MTAPTPYFHFRGEARAALTHYADVFGSGVELHTFDEFGRTDGPADAVAHGFLVTDRSRSSLPTSPGTSPRSAARA